MFDLRYHVASLAAVFVALVIGILVGVGLSGKGSSTTPSGRTSRHGSTICAPARRRRGARRGRRQTRRAALDDFRENDVSRSWSTAGSTGRRSRVLFVGSVDQGDRGHDPPRRSRDAGGTRCAACARSGCRSTRTRSTGALGAKPSAQRLRGPGNRERLGRELAREFVAAGRIRSATRSRASSSRSSPVRHAPPSTPSSSRARRRRSRARRRTSSPASTAALRAAPLPAVGRREEPTRRSAPSRCSAARASRRSTRSTTPPARSALVLLLAGARPGSYGVDETATDGVLPTPPPRPRRARGDGRLTVLVAARDEEERIGATVDGASREPSRRRTIVVADDGSRDGTAGSSRGGGRARRPPPAARQGPGADARRARRARPGRCSSATPTCAATSGRSLDTRRRSRRSRPSPARSAVASGSRRRLARALIACAPGSTHARAALRPAGALARGRARPCFPVAAGFGVETRMTIDAVRAGLDVREVELDLEHRADAPRRCAASPTVAGSSLDLDARVRAATASTSAVCGCRSSGRSSGSPSPPSLPSRDRARGRPLERARARLPRAPARRRDDGHAQARRDPALGALADALAVRRGARRPRGERRSTSSTRARARAQGVPARRLLLLGGRPRRALAVAVLLAPYDHREMTMLGDAGSNALGAVLGLESVRRLTGRRRWSAIGALAALTLLGERRSLGALIESTPGAASPRRARTAPVSDRPTKYVFVTGGVVSALGKGIVAASLGTAAEGARPARAGAEVRPVPERRPGHDEPVPARRGVRDRGRRRDRSRPRPLRALHRREPVAERAATPPARSGTPCCARSARASSSARPCR